MSVANCANSVIRAPGQDNFRNGPRARFRFYSGFTLIELVVVIAIIAILAAMLFPVLSAAKDSGKQARCAAQIKQLTAASIAYSDDYDGRYVPAAPDIFSFDPSGGRRRWHGRREQSIQPFDPRKGPLWDYIARSGGLKQCPSAPDLKGVNDFAGAFETGCGGFGYNSQYVGGTYYKNPYPKSAQVASACTDIANPQRTVMFADCAMAMKDPDSGRAVLVEYSFLEPPYMVWVNADGEAVLSRTASPSIHFRHADKANVAWCDGHVTSEEFSFTNPEKNTYQCDNGQCRLGWFGPDDNSLFDNK